METAAVWENGAPSLAVGEWTLVLHRTAIASLDEMLRAQIESELALNRARATRDASYQIIASLCMRGCQVIHGSLPPEESLRDDVRRVRGVRQESQGALLSKGQRLVSLWQKVNAFCAGMTPPQPALLVGTTGLGAFQQMLEEHSALLQSVEDMMSEMNARKNAMRNLVTRLDQNNKRWYEAWKGQFPEGSDTRELLRQISTGPKRHAPAQTVRLSAEALPNGQARLAFDAVRGTSFTLLHRAARSDGIHASAGKDSVEGFHHGTAASRLSRVAGDRPQ